MTGYVSILSCISEPSQEAQETEELNEEELKEVGEIVEDLISMQNKEILKRNLTTIVKENQRYKKKIKIMETDLEGRKDNMSFQIDCDGSEVEEEGVQATVSYPAQSVFVLGEKSEPEASTPSKGGTCFNCEGPHLLSDCTLPRDETKISKKRAEMRNNKTLSTARYHLEENQKYGHLQPGLPSPALREALGLRKDELPRYIYLMRELGYPPGWLREAEVTQSGLSLYHDRQGQDKMDTGEEGEVKEVEEVKGGEVQYDIDKLISWPGFNSELPKDFRDDTRWHRARPMAPDQSVSVMAERLGAKSHSSYVRGEMEDLSTSRVDSTGDMVAPGEEEEEDKPDRVETPVKERVKATDSGTPIVHLHSPFQNVPKYANFGVNMTEHIAFENLPNATGKWDQMRNGILKKVREKMSVEST